MLVAGPVGLLQLEAAHRADSRLMVEHALRGLLVLPAAIEFLRRATQNVPGLTVQAILRAAAIHKNSNNASARALAQKRGRHNALYGGDYKRRREASGL